MAVEGSEVLPQLASIHEAVDPAQQMIAGNVIFEIERVEQRRLAGALASHHGRPLELVVAQIDEIKGSFSIVRPKADNASLN